MKNSRDYPDLPADILHVLRPLRAARDRLPHAGPRDRPHRPGPRPRPRRRRRAGSTSSTARARGRSPTRHVEPAGRGAAGRTRSARTSTTASRPRSPSPTSTGKGAVQDPLPPAGPARARAAIFGTGTRHVRRGRRATCSWPARRSGRGRPVRMHRAGKARPERRRAATTSRPAEPRSSASSCRGRRAASSTAAAHSPSPRPRGTWTTPAGPSRAPRSPSALRPELGEHLVRVLAERRTRPSCSGRASDTTGSGKSNGPPSSSPIEPALRQQRVAPCVADAAQRLAHPAGGVDPLDPLVRRRGGDHLGDAAVDELRDSRAARRPSRSAGPPASRGRSSAVHSASQWRSWRATTWTCAPSAASNTALGTRA